MAYNDQHIHSLGLRHLFVPSPIVLALEAVFAVCLVSIASLGSFSAAIEATFKDETSPISYTTKLSETIWGSINNVPFLGQLSLFLAWAFLGLVLYVFGFKLVQFIMTNILSVKETVDFIKTTDKSKGALHSLLIDLQRGITKILIIVAGLGLIFFVAVICFSYGLAQAKIGIAMFPSSLYSFGLAFLAGFLAVRTFMIGACFLLPSLRGWYSV